MAPFTHLPYSHNGLKTFESVARLMSFTLAANELHVTQSAVSRQVKQLEHELNTSLVVRMHRSIELTPQGQALYSVLNKNYQSLESLLASWQKNSKKKIVIKAAFSFTTRTLIPKIQQLKERYPDYEIVMIPTMDEEIALNGTDYDVLIFNTRVGHRFGGDHDVMFLRDEYMAPVFSQSLASSNLDLKSVVKMPRLHSTLDHHDWKTWFASFGQRDTGVISDMTFSSLDLALSACAAGNGVTVTDLLLILPELERGFLVCPEGIQIQHSAWKYFCHKRTDSPVIKDLIDWIFSETDREVNQLTTIAEQYGWNGVISS